jgi:RNA polymerase sigma-70 factor, ECF subfamily
VDDVPDPVRAAHERLIAGDRTASEDLARLLLEPLVNRLRGRWRRWQHTDRLYDAAVDVFLDYVEAPERYDPGGGPLLRWLEVAAQGDLTNAYRSRRQKQEIELTPLSATGRPDRPPQELPPNVIPIGAARLAPDPADARRLDLLDIWSRIRLAFPEPTEREFVWACFVEGERSSERLAKILGVDHLRVEVQRRRVKNARDVAHRKLRRLIDDVE